jgi:predicted DNA-binding protein
MKRTMIFLPGEMHQGLKRLAVERERSVAELIREAVVQAYQEDLEDIHDAEQELAKYKKGIDYASYRAKRLKG